MSPTAPQLPTLTPNRNIDLILIVLLIGFMILGGLRLRVYYMVNAIQVEAVRELPDGSRTALMIPRHLERSGAAGGRMPDRLAAVERYIRRYMMKNVPQEDIASGNRYHWTIRYSVNTPALDQTRTLLWP